MAEEIYRHSTRLEKMIEDAFRQNKLAYIDMMRGCAILMVIAVHTSQQFTRITPQIKLLAQYGQMGVQLFFVASAYSLCLSWVRRQDEPNRLAKFYLRRLFRIAPLYYLAIIVYFSVHLGVQMLQGAQHLEFHQYNFESIAANVFFIHGVYPSANENVVPGGWSIGTEMAFYLIFPVLFAIFERANSRGQSLLLWCLVMLSMIPNLLNLAILSRSDGFTNTLNNLFYNNSFAYQHLLNQLPVFLIGIVAFYEHQRSNQPKSKYYSYRQALYFLLATLVSFVLMTTKESFGYLIIPMISGISFYFLMSTLRCVEKPNLLLSKIGQASYSIYVFHFIFWWYLPQFVAPSIVKVASILFAPTSAENLALFSCFILVSSLSYAAAYFTQKWIEARGIALGNSIIARI
jgi:peptidoglycan/LPS O-acetylase OafA/YrhL